MFRRKYFSNSVVTVFINSLYLNFVLIELKKRRNCSFNIIKIIIIHLIGYEAMLLTV